MLTTVYKKVEITFDEDTELWTTKEHGCDLSLKAMKRKIDAHIKKEKGFGKIQVYINNGWNRDHYALVTITSINEQGEVWIKHNDDGRREKKYAHQEFYENTDFNRDIFQKLDELIKEQQRISKEKDELKSQLQIYNPRD